MVSENFYKTVALWVVLMMMIEFLLFRLAAISEKEWMPLILLGAFVVEALVVFLFVRLLRKMILFLNELKMRLQTARRQRHQAEDSTQMKSLFLANMSHEIRAPLSAILGFIELLRDPAISEKERIQYLDVIERTGNSLSTIINDILDLSKVEAGKLEIQKTICCLPRLLKDLEQLMGLRCTSKGIFLRCLIDESVPEWIYTDPVRLRQILLNVIGNAVKFTSQGGITVSCFVKGRNIVFVIDDSGMGIAEENIGKLFMNFSQVSFPFCSGQRGTGLGLVLSRNFARLLAGEVYLEKSQVGVGSTFVVRISLDQTENYQEKLLIGISERANLNLENRLFGKKILLIDDSPENQFVVRKFLLKSGAEVEIASNGLEGVGRALDHGFDVILMDMQMPVMDGYAATEKLRQEGYFKPILGLTAHAMKKDIEKCLQSGCNEVLAKPVNRHQLLEFVGKFCN